ncbi:MAG TPA: prepilin peptidase [Rhodopila sp.]|nr:prepilin peptidase [Rhodopila sp.]
MDWLTVIVASLSIVFLLLAALNDIATRLIPNCLPIALAVLGVATRLMTGPTALGLSCAVALGVFALLLLLHARGALGGGDVKLAAAVCLGLSPFAAWRFIVITSLAGGVLAILHILGRRAFSGSGTIAPAPNGSALLTRVLRTERWRIARHGSLSYGVAIACGGIWAIVESRGF